MIASVDQDEFETFVRSSSDRLMRTGYLLTGSRHEAEELVQMALLRTARQWRRAKRAPYAYARRAVVNLAKDRWRYLSRRPVQSTGEIEAVDARCRSAESEIDRVLQRDLVLRAVNELPEGQRAVVVLRYLEDLTVQETARILGCSAGAVKTQASRALRRLRSVMEPPEAPLPDNALAGRQGEQHHAGR